MSLNLLQPLVKGQCQCTFGHAGATCDYNFSKDNNWLAGYYSTRSLLFSLTFQAMGAITSLLNLMLLIWAIYLLRNKIQFKENTYRLKKPWNVLHTILLLIIFAAASKWNALL
jgi:hypothetical protein